MAIEYTKIGWDTSKYVNPKNMNQMDNGIKAACDGVDAHDTAIAGKVSKSGDIMSGNLSITPNGYAGLIVGNQSDGNSHGFVQFYRGSNYTALYVNDILSNDIAVYLPNQTGTLALKDDLSTLQFSGYVSSNFQYPTGAIDKKNNIVSMSVSAAITSSQSSVQMFTLPTGYRPIVQFLGTCCAVNPQVTTVVTGRVTINTSGVATVMFPSAIPTGYYVEVSATYCVQ